MSSQINLGVNVNCCLGVKHSRNLEQEVEVEAKLDSTHEHHVGKRTKREILAADVSQITTSRIAMET